MRGVVGDCIEGAASRTDTLIPSSADECLGSVTVAVPCDVSEQAVASADDSLDEEVELTISG